MYDKALAIEILRQIQNAARTVLKRFKPVDSPDSFTSSDAGLEKLDSICMQCIAIGESLKNFDKVTQKTLLHQYPQVEWKKAKGLRDIISHHYFDLNAEAIFEVCTRHMPVLEKTVTRIIQDISK
jgi:uncharacterized protein with HEPN domain